MSFHRGRFPEEPAIIPENELGLVLTRRQLIPYCYRGFEAQAKATTGGRSGFDDSLLISPSAREGKR